VTREILNSLLKRVSKEMEVEKERLATELEEEGRRLTRADEERLAQSVIARVVAEWSTDYRVHDPLDREDEAAVRGLLFNWQYRAGPLQPYLDDPDVEEIVVDGDRVTLHFFDRPPKQVAPLAADDEELRRVLNQVLGQAATGDRNRQLTTARPNAHAQLGDHRIAATLLTPRPTAVVRRHRLRDHSLEDLITRYTLDPLLVAFLETCVRARMNLLIAGDMGAGKTTLMRALGRKIPTVERLVTMEDVYELGLHKLSGGPQTFAFQTRESGGERALDGRLIGEIGIGDMFAHTLRFGAQRVMVGEVRSVEIVPMLDAMSGGGSGSMCTLHARRARDVLERLMLLCLRAGLPEAAAARLVATSIDFVVYLERVIDHAGQWRYVSHVLEVAGVAESGRQVATNEVFAPHPGSPNNRRAVYTGHLQCLPELERVEPRIRTWVQGGSRWGDRERLT
jgi:pilus assembly protein CpaF